MAQGGGGGGSNNAGNTGNNGGGNNNNNKKPEEVQPQPVKEQLPGIQYCINSPPPWRPYSFSYILYFFFDNSIVTEHVMPLSYKAFCITSYIEIYWFCFLMLYFSFDLYVILLDHCTDPFIN